MGLFIGVPRRLSIYKTEFGKSPQFRKRSVLLQNVASCNVNVTCHLTELLLNVAADSVDITKRKTYYKT
jgi:hypothetical protein